MSYPQFTDFNEAIQNPRTAFTDAELQAARPDLNGLGLPVALGGGFTYTYPMTTPRRKVAVRCFHREIPSAEQRYAAISRALSALASPHFVTFDYQPEGIRVRGKGYPIVRMEWVPGHTLGVFLERNLNKANVLENLRARFRAMALDLQRAGIAHGDIQNLNVLVVGTELRLIDYDGMYAPPMQTGRGAEVGHKHWQHPRRLQEDFGPDMDRFSFIVVDLSLRALAADPTLYARFSEGGETIIFKANDFADPAGSEVFRLLMASPELHSAATNLARICDAPISQAPTLEDYIAGNNIPAAKLRVGPRDPAAAKKAGRAPYISAYPLVSADDFFAAKRNVGNRVEIIGKVTDVKYNIGKRGKGKDKQYVFVNFGAWNSDIVKLTAWSEALIDMSSKPDSSWVGKWVSVAGLIEAPYTNHRYRYTHVGITLTADGQVQFISESEAAYRLGKPDAAAAPRRPSNRDVLQRLAVNRQIGSTSSPAASRNSMPRPSNRAVLNQMTQSGPATNRAPPPGANRSRNVATPVWALLTLALSLLLAVYYSGH